MKNKLWFKLAPLTAQKHKDGTYGLYKGQDRYADDMTKEVAEGIELSVNSREGLLDCVRVSLNAANERISCIDDSIKESGSDEDLRDQRGNWVFLRDKYAAAIAKAEGR